MNEIVRRREDDAVGTVELFDKLVPIVGKRAAFFPLVDAAFASPTGLQIVLAQPNELVLDIVIVVLNGSPKGENSITLQYVRYLQKCHPDEDWTVFHVSKRIHALERDEGAFCAIIDAVRAADGVLWSFRVFILSVSSQLMRFIELICERDLMGAFAKKYTAVLSTSIHSFDHLAHNYLRAVCEDLGMRYVDGLSLDLRDLAEERQREKLRHFAETFLTAVKAHRTTMTAYPPLRFSDVRYRPSPPTEDIDPEGKRVLILTDTSDPETNLVKMLGRFRAAFADPTAIEMIDLNDIDIRNGCFGCMRCGYDHHCVQKDGFAAFYNERLRTADIIVFAGTLWNASWGRYLSSTWKKFYDRAFFWNHTPSLAGKQLGYIVSGPISQNGDLVQLLEASCTARQDANFAGIVSDEDKDPAQIDAQLDAFATRLVEWSVRGYIKPENFSALGGHKIFQDDIWGRLRMIWQADHRYYKTHGKYDFPQKKLKMRLMTAIMMLMMKFPTFRQRFYANLTKFPAQQLEKIVERCDCGE